jgi:hypothetical protein
VLEVGSGERKRVLFSFPLSHLIREWETFKRKLVVVGPDGRDAQASAKSTLELFRTRQMEKSPWPWWIWPRRLLSGDPHPVHPLDPLVKTGPGRWLLRSVQMGPLSEETAALFVGG